MQEIFIFNGREIRFNLVRCDFAKLFNETNLTDALVQFNPSMSKVTVDTRVDENYALFAGVHECICCGEYGYLAPVMVKRENRCGLIDKMLLEECIPESYAETYRHKRIEMYKTLIEKNLNPTLNAQFKKAISILQKLVL